jgi:hypothetical protein
VSDSWVEAFALVSSAHQDEFEEVCAAAIDTGDAIIMRHDLLRVRVRDPAEEGVLLLALTRCGQHHRVAPGSYGFPADWESEVCDIVSFHGIRASVVPSACFELEVRHHGALDALPAALLRRAPTFGPTYPRITVA